MPCELPDLLGHTIPCSYCCVCFTTRFFLYAVACDNGVSKCCYPDQECCELSTGVWPMQCHPVLLFTICSASSISLAGFFRLQWCAALEHS